MTFEEMESRYDKVLELKKYFVERLNEIKDIRVNGEIDGFSPYILNVSFLGVRAEVLLHLLEEQNIYVATGSACTSKSSAAHGSYVIKSLGLSNKEVESAIRFSFSYENTKEEVDYTIDVLKKSLMFLRRVKKMNNKLILVKYASEIFLKGLNRGKFERKLKENIEKKLSGLEFEFVTDQGRGFY